MLKKERGKKKRGKKKGGKMTILKIRLKSIHESKFIVRIYELCINSFISI